MTPPRTVVITGAASGIGAATKARLEADGQRVIGLDLRGSDVDADLGTTEGRAHAISEVGRISDGRIDGLVTCAGVPGLTGVPGSLLVSVNYVGTVALLQGLRPLLATGDRPAAVAISSNSTVIQPGVPMDVIELCLADDEAAARIAADAAGALGAYPATKTAVAWWVRRQAPGPVWAGSGITLNVIAPGAIETPLLDATRGDPEIGHFVDQLPIPVGRKGTAEEIAAFAAFLLGPDARFFCGSVLFADGGTYAQLRPDDDPRPWEL